MTKWAETDFSLLALPLIITIKDVLSTVQYSATIARYAVISRALRILGASSWLYSEVTVYCFVSNTYVLSFITFRRARIYCIRTSAPPWTRYTRYFLIPSFQIASSFFVRLIRTCSRYAVSEIPSMTAEQQPRQMMQATIDEHGDPDPITTSHPSLTRQESF